MLLWCAAKIEGWQYRYLATTIKNLNSKTSSYLNIFNRFSIYKYFRMYNNTLIALYTFVVDSKQWTICWDISICSNLIIDNIELKISRL